MAEFKAAYPVAAPIVGKNADGSPKYGEGVTVGELIKVDLTPNFNEAPLYGDNILLTNKRVFRDVEISLNVSRLPIAVYETLFGQKVEKENGRIIANVNDVPKEVGFGFVVGEANLDTGGDIYWMIWLHKATFSPPSESYATNGESITFGTPTISGKGGAAESGDWREGRRFPTEAAAIAALKEKAGITAAAGTLGELTVTSAAGTNTGDTSITVTPALETGHSYKYKIAANPTMPVYEQVCASGWMSWDGTADITATAGQKIIVAEVDAENKAVRAGAATVTVKE